MNPLTFRIVVSFDEVSYVPSIGYLTIRQGKVHTTEEVVDGLIFVDYDENGRTLGLEILDEVPLEAIHLLCEDETDEIRDKIQALVSKISDIMALAKTA